MKIQTSELAGAALDWAVAKCEGKFFAEAGEKFKPAYSPSTDWSQGGPIIERESMGVFPLGEGWAAGFQNGPTPLVAAMRCYCCAKLGDEVDIPEELL